MFELQSERLTVLILDPLADRDRLGSRYCSGGYIWHVGDVEDRPLVVGPRFPDENPPPFEGQGLPDAFEAAIGAENAEVGEVVCVIGVGDVAVTSSERPFHVRNNPYVEVPCQWDIDMNPNSMVFRTQQQYGSAKLTLERTVLVGDARVISETTISSTGTGVVPIKWFPHPFFPHTSDHSYCRFNRPVAIPPNPGYGMGADGFLEILPGFPWSEGLYQPLRIRPGKPMIVDQKHPQVGFVRITCDFPIDYLPVWANRSTFSFEPYFVAELSLGAETTWRITYDFAYPE